MSYDPEAQAKYNATEKGKARKRKWQQNMSEAQREKKRLANREHMRRKRAEAKKLKEE